MRYNKHSWRQTIEAAQDYAEKCKQNMFVYRGTDGFVLTKEDKGRCALLALVEPCGAVAQYNGRGEIEIYTTGRTR